MEIRKLLPKGAGARFDRLTEADCALLTSQVNSEPRGAARVPDAGARAEDGPRGGRLRPHGRVRDRGAGARRARPHAWRIDRDRAARGEDPLAGQPAGRDMGRRARCAVSGTAARWAGGACRGSVGTRASTAPPPAETRRWPDAGGYFRIALAAETRGPFRLLR